VHLRLAPEDFEVRRHGARYEQQVWAGGSDDLVGEGGASFHAYEV
jgi:hypothetical protein